MTEVIIKLCPDLISAQAQETVLSKLGLAVKRQWIEKNETGLHDAPTLGTVSIGNLFPNGVWVVSGIQ
jgi:hypothetical protein